jgi:hypothetical protein
MHVVRFRVVMNMSQKFFCQFLLGFVLSSVYIVTFLLTVEQQRTSYLSVTQAHSPQKFLNLSAEEINRRTLTAAAAIDLSHRRY